MPQALDIQAERDALVGRLRLLEEGGASARQLRACQRAISWIDRREAGPHDFAWGPRGLARGNIIGIGLLCLGSMVVGHNPFSFWRVVGEVGIWTVFGIGGGIWLSRFAWRASQEGFNKELSAAAADIGALPRPSTAT